MPAAFKRYQVLDQLMPSEVDALYRVMCLTASTASSCPSSAVIGAV